MGFLKRGRTAVMGASASRDKNDTDTAWIFLAIADRAMLEAERAIADVRADIFAIRSELQRRQLVAGARVVEPKK